MGRTQGGRSTSAGDAKRKATDQAQHVHASASGAGQPQPSPPSEPEEAAGPPPLEAIPATASPETKSGGRKPKAKAKSKAKKQPRTGGLGRASWAAAAAVLALALATAGAARLWRLCGSAAGPRGPKVTSDANGYFPAGCRWREVYYEGAKPKFWDVRQYEYWDEAASSWGVQQPAACTVPGVPRPKAWPWRGGSPATTGGCGTHYCMFDNLWLNNGRFYRVVEGGGSAPEAPLKMTHDVEVTPLHVRDMAAFLASTDHRVLAGDTLLFDFVFFLHPTAIGHWSEMLFPLFSVHHMEPSFKWPPDQVLLLHLKRAHLMEWPRAMLATALGVPPGGDLPPIVWQHEVDSVWRQILSPLEGLPPTDWVCLERVLAVRDTLVGGVRTFTERAHAHDFRARAYAQSGLPPPAPRDPFPRVLTFQRKRANRRVLNEDELLGMLAEFGEVRVVEFNDSTPVAAQLATMASTGVLVAVHTSNLANAQFLQPGSAVVELIQRNWIWHNLDESFKVQTEAMGDLHHFAWRARGREHARYINAHDEKRFGDWAPLQCDTEECVEAHTNVDVIVDVPALRALLASRLPLVYAGASVEEAKLPWPDRE